MDRDKFLEMVQKLPKGTNIVVRGGGAASDDAWSPTIKVFDVGTKDRRQFTAVVEGDWINREHYNYPERYSGVKEVTGEFFPETLKYQLTEEEKVLLKTDRYAATKAFMKRSGLDQHDAKYIIDKEWYKDA